MTITVTADDVADRWQPLTSAQEALATVLIADTIELLNNEFPTLEAAVGDSVSAALVTRVVVSTVLRVLQNPDGLRQEAIGNYSYTRDQALSDGSLYLAAADRGTISRALGIGRGAGFTIRPYGEPDTSLLDEFA